jgi:hypothetical protein
MELHLTDKHNIINRISHAAHITACSKVHVLVFNLIYQLFLFSMLEDFFSSCPFITQNTSEVQIFLWLQCIPHTIYGKSTDNGVVM